MSENPQMLSTETYAGKYVSTELMRNLFFTMKKTSGH